MRTSWKRETSKERPEDFKQHDAQTVIQNRNIEKRPDNDRGEPQGWTFETRKISMDIYNDYMDMFNSPVYVRILHDLRIIQDVVHINHILLLDMGEMLVKGLQPTINLYCSLIINKRIQFEDVPEDKQDEVRLRLINLGYDTNGDLFAGTHL